MLNNVNKNRSAIIHCAFIIVFVILSLSVLNTKSFGYKSLVADKFSSLEGKKIKDIKYFGLKYTASDVIAANITLEKGQIFRYDILRQEFKTLYNLGYFSDIRVEAELTDSDKIIIKYFFKELPVIRSIQFKGNDELSDDKLVEVMYLRTNNVFKESTLKEDKNRIIRLYRKNGYEGTIVNISANLSPDERYVDVIINIREGEEVSVKKITIKGAKYLSPEDIKDAMETEEPGWFSSDPLDEDKLEDDRAKIIQFCKDNGFIKAEIKDIDVKKKRLSPDSKDDFEKGYYITITIEEGDQYRLGDVKFSGYKIFNKRQLHRWVLSSKGTVYNDSRFKADIARIQAAYYDRGYINAQIVPIERIDEKNKIIHFDITISENAKVHIERIIIKGNDKTMTHVIDRELNIREGEVFSLSKIRRSVEKLTNLQFFKKIEPKPSPGSEDGLVDLIIEVEEQRTGIVTLGAGYGTANGFSGFVQVTERNFLGSGWAVGARVEYGERIQRYELNTQTNWLFPYTPLGFQAAVSYNYYTIPIYDTDIEPITAGEDVEYNLKSWQIDLGLSYFLTDRLIVFGGVYFDLNRPTNNTFPIDTNLRNNYETLYEDFRKNRWISRRTMRTGITYDKRDFFLDPTKGYKVTLIGRYTGGLIGGDSQWLRIRNDYSYYLQTGRIIPGSDWKWVNAFYLSLETTFKQFDGDYDITYNSLLRFDGLNELRGYDLYDFSGCGKTYFSYELRWPVFKPILYWVWFLDAGDIIPNVDDNHSSDNPKGLGKIPTKISDFYYSVGGGLRVQIPFFPIRLYLARRFRTEDWAYKEDPGDNNWQFRFSIGGMF